MTALPMHPAAEADIASEFTGLRILVVGINYPPEHTGIAPYTAQACEYLQRHGAVMLVLAGVPHYPHWSVGKPYKHRLRVDEVRREGVRVRRLRHTVPARQSAIKRATYEATFGLHVLSQRVPWKPDVVLAVVPSLFGAMAAASIAKRHKARLAVWVQDLMGPAAAQSGIAGGGKVAQVTERIEARLLRQADVVIVLSESFARYAEESGVPRDRIVIRPNWVHVELPRGDRTALRDQLAWGDDIVVLHSGNMGLKQGLENVVSAARLAAKNAPNVRFVLMGDGSQRSELQKLAADVPTLQFLPSAPAEDYSDFLAAADVLLVNERASAVNMSVPSKLTSYFCAGVPVVAAVPLDGSTGREVERSQAGIVVPPEDCGALLKGVVSLAADEALCQELRRGSSAYVHERLESETAVADLAAAATGRR